MIRNQILASLALVGVLGLAAPALAQQATTQIAILDGDATVDYRAAGAVSAEVPFSTSGAALPKRQLDDMLRAEAAKLGADAVILVTYHLTSAATPNAGHRASGVAIRYLRAQAAIAPPVAVPALPQVAAAVPPAAPIVVPAPQVAAAPPPPVAIAPTATIPTATIPAAAVAASAIMHAAVPEQVILTEADLVGRRYVRIGPVSATVHQKSMFTKVSEMEQTQQALRKAAHAKGADAVIEVKYKMTNSLFSKEGDTGSGIAIRFE